MDKVLPKHAYIAYRDLVSIEKEVMQSKGWADEYFKDEKEYGIGKTINISTYLEMLLTVSACMDKEINATEVKAIQFLTGTTERYQTATKESINFVKNIPPAVIYLAFAYQNEKDIVVLPKVLEKISTLIDFIDQLNVGGEGSKLFSEIKTLYSDCLQKKHSGSITANNSDASDDKPVNIDEALEKLNALVGLEQIKADISSMVDLIKLREIRKTHNLPNPEMSFHMVFSGNPGTGKTSVARIVADIYKALGVVSKGQLVETDRSGLVGEYVGRTAVKVNEVVETAIGGVLFIDEAYSLARSNENDYGKEAIDTLLKLMEDNRNDLVVIVAGYTDLMENFLDANPGLRSRFNKRFEFPDYTSDELMCIFERMCAESNYVLNDNASDFSRQYFDRLTFNKGKDFGNARDVRNYFERAVSKQASRIVKINNPSKEDVMQLTIEDLE